MIIIYCVIVISDYAFLQTTNFIEESSTVKCSALDRRIEHLEATFIEQKLEIKSLMERVMHNQDHLVNQLNQILVHLKETTTTNLPSQNHPEYRPQGALSNSEQSNTISSCAEEPTKVSGKYSLSLFANEQPFEGYCEQEAFKGGWLVIQRRFDGSIDFNRNWTEYRDGFGSIEGEFWIGLEIVHRLTKHRNCMLLIELQDLNGKYVYAQYDGLEIGSEEEKYSLNKLGKYSGTAGDSLSRHHKGMMFSTKDNDNDKDPRKNCAVYVTGAWWFRSCLDSNLNGLYLDENKRKTITWYNYKKKLGGFKSTRMMIREK